MHVKNTHGLFRDVRACKKPLPSVFFCVNTAQVSPGPVVDTIFTKFGMLCVCAFESKVWVVPSNVVCGVFLLNCYSWFHSFNQRNITIRFFQKIRINVKADLNWKLSHWKLMECG